MTEISIKEASSAVSIALQPSAHGEFQVEVRISSGSLVPVKEPRPDYAKVVRSFDNSFLEEMKARVREHFRKVVALA